MHFIHYCYSLKVTALSVFQNFWVNTNCKAMVETTKWFSNRECIPKCKKRSSSLISLLWYLINCWIMGTVCYKCFWKNKQTNKQKQKLGWAVVKSGRMGRSDKVSLWCVSLLINTRFCFFILELVIVKCI